MKGLCVCEILLGRSLIFVCNSRDEAALWKAILHEQSFKSLIFICLHLVRCNSDEVCRVFFAGTGAFVPISSDARHSLEGGGPSKQHSPRKMKPHEHAISFFKLFRDFHAGRQYVGKDEERHRLFETCEMAKVTMTSHASHRFCSVMSSCFLTCSTGCFTAVKSTAEAMDRVRRFLHQDGKTVMI